ncbi:hypothetical protein DEA98_22620 [Brucella pseudogrignonensis]|uniref:Uncharacterized protein n=1 Tax=Brucella pseudogrignonensis TaxID=419475 RepID=A0A7Y3WVW0_9HYPH|nr:hypothetical protein [Brucella pseudogrignonensis]EMG52624.1 hypothetical protein WYI_16309 [Ochrobactrum sp. CDB2]MCM0752899.1 hypothetical protein [Brucella pseudogrignonensis]NKX16721.1 hypothetical protein [Brucella pseudogrignonensis]NNV19481.1 hypothetical protein [Brucella pseudogrignonensis]
MPLFSQSSKVYAPDELEAMRRCFSIASIMLEESGREYDEAHLAETIIKLYDGGLRNMEKWAELAARLAEKHANEFLNAGLDNANWSKTG